MLDRNTCFILFIMLSLVCGGAVYGELIQLLSDNTKYAGFNEDGIIDSALAKPKNVDSVTVGGTLIPATAFKPVRSDEGSVIDMARVILIAPDAPQKVKNFYQKLASGTDIVLIETSPGTLEIVAGSGQQSVTYIKEIIQVDLQIWPGGSDLDNGEENRACPGDDDNAYLSPSQENSEGAFVLVNWDDDDEDGNLTAGEAGWADPMPDLYEDHPGVEIENEDNLARIVLAFPLLDIKNGTVKLEITNSEKIQLWSSKTKGTPISYPTGGKIWDLSENPSGANLFLAMLCTEGYWIEGLEESALKEVEIKVTFQLNGYELSDSVKLTIVMMNLGNALYREMGLGGARQRGHTGISYKFYGNLYENSIKRQENYSICEMQLSAGGPVEVPLPLITSLPDRDYWYCYTTPHTGYSDRLKILRVGWWALNQWQNTNYTWISCIDPKLISWDGTLSDIDELRCDGLVELAYEYNGIMLWGKIVEGDPYPHYDIKVPEYLDEHNNWQWGDDPEDFEWDMWTTMLPVTQGGYADQYIRERPDYEHPGEDFKGQFWDTKFGLSNEQRLVLPEGLSPESHNH